MALSVIKNLGAYVKRNSTQIARIEQINADLPLKIYQLKSVVFALSVCLLGDGGCAFVHQPKLQTCTGNGAFNF